MSSNVKHNLPTLSVGTDLKHLPKSGFTTSPTDTSVPTSPVTNQPSSPTGHNSITLCRNCTRRQSRDSQRQSFENLTLLSRTNSTTSLQSLLTQLGPESPELLAFKRITSVVSLASAIVNEDIDGSLCRTCAKRQARDLESQRKTFREMTGSSAMPKASGSRKSLDSPIGGKGMDVGGGMSAHDQEDTSESQAKFIEDEEKVLGNQWFSAQYEVEIRKGKSGDRHGSRRL